MSFILSMLNTLHVPLPDSKLEKAGEWVRQAVGRRGIPGLANPGRQWDSLRGSAPRSLSFPLHSSIARACLCVIPGSPIAFGDVAGRVRQKSCPFALSLSPVVPCISSPSARELLFAFPFSLSPLFPLLRFSHFRTTVFPSSLASFHLEVEAIGSKKRAVTP